MTALRQEDVVAVIDSREQLPYSLEPLQTVQGTLQTGDYSVRGLERDLTVERKSVGDLIGCMTGEGRERFTRELERLQAFRHVAIVVEGDWMTLVNGGYRSKLNPKSATNSVTSWISKYAVPFVFVGDREAGQDFVRNFLFLTAKAEMLRLEAFRKSLDVEVEG